MTELEAPTTMQQGGDDRVRLGIAPVDDRLGGLERGGSYLVVGPPGPVKMVSVLQFLRQGLEQEERCVLLTGADAKGILHAARGWGVDAEDHWKEGRLTILGFRDDFELRAARTIAPEEVLEELETQIPPDAERIAVDPGTLFLAGEGRTLLGGAFLRWAREQAATVCTTYSVDTDKGFLPSSADWLVHGTTGRLVVVPTAGGLFEMSFIRSVPHEPEEEAPVSLQLRPGTGLVHPESFPARRSEDREGLDRGRLLIVSLAGDDGADLAEWAGSAFDTTVVADALEAVKRIQTRGGYGSVVVHAERAHLDQAVQACQALRPLTRAALVVASDDTIRSRDRVELLEAGADDCLTGGLDFRELGLRLRQAMSSNARPLPPRVEGADDGEDPDPRGGTVEWNVFQGEALRRAADPLLGVFCLLEIRANGFDQKRLMKLVEQEIRDDDGDLLTRTGPAALVLLQGARANQAQPFLARLRERLGAESRKGKGELAVDVLSHPGDGKRIRAVLEADRGRSE